jgi:hypothetical protein
MNTKSAIPLLIALLPLYIFAQSRISGTITDRQSKLPVEFASVYINGSTNGTLTDSLGFFHLENVVLPCTIIVSHLSYITQTKYISDGSLSNLDFYMETKINKIEGVNVTDKDLRKDNLKFFKEKFLGKDVWGRHASIENEDAIQFTRDYTNELVSVKNKKELKSISEVAYDYETSDDSSYISFKIASNLKANSLEPLKIELPLLGYTVYLDLIEFIWKPQSYSEQEMCTIKGYSYFIENAYRSKRDSIRINKNREKCYYNSPHHFCRSLYNNRLAENGYMMHGVIDNLFGWDILDLNPTEYLQKEGKYVKIKGLNNMKLFISYSDDQHGKPKDLNKYKEVRPVKSQIIFLQDTCIIRDNGTIPGNTIVFGPPVGNKKVGAMLPDDYVP